ncbi:MAG: response regulator [Nitriliruptorales bacterium]|nr:response regulator [Nitriliruptorales bacterium]
MGDARRVLIVDDDPIILDIVTTVLDLEDFSVTTAEDGETALELVAKEPPDVMVLDVMMPGMSGLEVCAKLRSSEEHARLPIVLLTARDTDEDRRAGMDAGADYYLSKPFSPLELIDIIEELLSVKP